MADTGIFCSRTEALTKAGARVSATTVTEAMTNQFITEAESLINSLTRVNYSDTYASLNVDKKGLLKLAASCIAGNFAINYDYINFFSLAEAQSTQNFNWNMAEKALKLLENKDTTAFVSSA
jgi:hypothetical protein